MRRAVTSPSTSATAAKAGRADPLQHYRAKRDFTRTPEPAAQSARRDRRAERPFVVQKHAATRLHYDFRLELDGVLLSWAVPKGPSLDPADKRMAVRTEDHPLAYAGFEGEIPTGEYGAGSVIVWDRGSWKPLDDPHRGLEQGKLAFELRGEKLRGQWELIRLARPGERQETWLLFKKRDDCARPRSEYDVTLAQPASVLGTGRRATATATAVASKTSVERPAGGAVPAALPATLAPQLATLASAVPAHGRWIIENKFDGYRILTRIEHGVPKLITRNGHDWTARIPVLAAELAGLGVDSAWLDGEIVVAGAAKAGKSAPTGDFNALQNAFDRSRTQAIEYMLFDVPYFEGHDLRDTPLSARRELLRALLDQRPGAHLHFSPALAQGAAAQAARVLAKVCAGGGEGLIAKRDDGAYRSSRSTAWLKLKCRLRQEFVVGGYSARADDASAVGSLILGVHDAQGRLQHAGSVGTGWDLEAARALLARLAKLRVDAPPFDGGARGAARWTRRGRDRECWVAPRLVAEVKFGEWTPAGHIRHASFVALRSDKPARDIVREAAAPPAEVPAAAAPRAAGHAAKPTADTTTARRLKVSHPERVIDAESGLTKLDLVRYYERIADAMLPHLRGRPVALLRAPGGVGEPVFFQKHGGKAGLPNVDELDAALSPGQQPLLELSSRAGLLGAAQMNVVEFHTWNSTTRLIDKPDRMIFDLDPGEGVAWRAVCEAALLTRNFLHALGLQSWLKTSGGKGLHVVVPLSPRWGFAAVKAFSKRVVEHLAQTIPARFVAKSGPANRKGRIFVDYLRNGEGATTVAAYSARARPGLGVSMPVAWDELPALTSGAHWTVRSAAEHVRTRAADPWSAMATTRQSIAAPMQTLGVAKPAR